jgi:hypothetical protein
LKKKVTCVYCADEGWSIRAYRFGWHVAGHSSLFHKGEDVYQCPYCNKPVDAPKPPEEMFSKK